MIRGIAEREVLKFCEEIGLKCAVDRSKLIGELETTKYFNEVSHLDFFTAQGRAKLCSLRLRRKAGKTFSIWNVGGAIMINCWHFAIGVAWLGEMPLRLEILLGSQMNSKRLPSLNRFVNTVICLHYAL